MTPKRNKRMRCRSFYTQTDTWPLRLDGRRLPKVAKPFQVLQLLLERGSFIPGLTCLRYSCPCLSATRGVCLCRRGGRRLCSLDSAEGRKGGQMLCSLDFARLRLSLGCQTGLQKRTFIIRVILVPEVH